MKSLRVTSYGFFFFGTAGSLDTNPEEEFSV